MTLFDAPARPHSRTPWTQRAIDELAEAPGASRGAVFTRPEVVGFMLDLIGYTSDRDLRAARLLEPAFGDGAFLLEAARRLLTSFRARGGDLARGGPALRPCLLGVELHRRSHNRVLEALRALLLDFGVPEAQGEELARAWLRQDDFLLTPVDGTFTHVVGNPPYLRQEAIHPALLDAYRAHYRTLYDRADLYVPFFERGLALLDPGGKLCFICSDRWLKNKYGVKLRGLIADGYHVAAHVDMNDADAFHDDVTAYPAITVIARERGRDTRLARRPVCSAEALGALGRGLRGEAPHEDVERVEWEARGDEPWLLDLGPKLAVLRDIEARHPNLEDAGCRVGIGVASGRDDVYVRPFEALDVEEDRKLPLAMSADVRGGALRWGGLGIVNPFLEDGRLVDLGAYPRLRAYLARHERALRARAVAKARPGAWYRTIDRITPALAGTPKLLIPDMSGAPTVAYDPGTCYPHHNLYFVTSPAWDLLALQAVLRSNVTALFIGAYSVKMRGGTLRFQAQNLRRLRLPRWEDVPADLRARLIALSDARDDALNVAVHDLYGLSAHQRALLGM